MVLAPTGLKLANMAVLLTKGISALPGGSLVAVIIAALIGVVLAVLDNRERLQWLPSAAGMGLGLILPGLLTVPVAIGGILAWLWKWRFPAGFDRYRFTLAAGLVAGDAFVSGLIVPVLATLRVLSIS